MTTASVRVLHVLAPAPFGGVESVVRRLAGLLDEQGAEIHVACVMTTSPANHPFVQAARSEGRRVHVVDAAGRAYVREKRLVADLIRRLQPHVVHTHGYRCDIVDAPVARRAHVPVVTTAHGFTGNSRRNRAYEWLQRRAFRRFDAVITVSDKLREQLLASGVDPRRLHVVPNAQAATDDQLTSDAARARLALSHDRNLPVIGWVGRMGPEKAPDVAVSAFTNPGLDNAILCFVGAGRMLSECQRLAAELGIENRVHFAGPVSDAGRLMKAFDALCVSSRTEGTPMVLFEADRAGLPVVATAVGGVPQVLGDGWNLVQPGDAEALGEALVRCIQEPAQARSAQARARERILKHFNPQSWVEGHLAIYRSLTR